MLNVEYRMSNVEMEKQINYHISHIRGHDHECVIVGGKMLFNIRYGNYGLTRNQATLPHFF